MKICINEQEFDLPNSTNLTQALAYYNVREKYYAVAVNQHFIPRIFYSTTQLHSGDVVDVIVPMQGG